MIETQRRAQGALFRYVVASGLFVLVGAITVVLLSIVTYLDAPTFGSAMASSEVLFAIRLTVLTSTITTAIAVCVGIPASYALSRYHISVRVPVLKRRPDGSYGLGWRRLSVHSFIDTLIDLPIVLPPIVAGIALLVFFQTQAGQWIQDNIIRLVFTPQGIVLAQLVPAGSFSVRALKAAFDGVDPRLEQVARTLGCSERQAFMRITLPLARNGLVAGAVMTWARAAGEFGPIVIFCGATRFRTEVLPIAIFLNMSVGNVEMALSVTVILIILAMAALLTFKKLGGRGYLW